MFDGPLMLQMNLPIVATIHSKGKKFVTGVKIKATGDSILNDSPVDDDINLCCITLHGHSTTRWPLLYVTHHQSAKKINFWACNHNVIARKLFPLAPRISSLTVLLWYEIPQIFSSETSFECSPGKWKTESTTLAIKAIRHQPLSLPADHTNKINYYVYFWGLTSEWLSIFLSSSLNTNILLLIIPQQPATMPSADW